MIAPVFLPGAETTEAVEKMTGRAMKWFAENVDNQKPCNPVKPAQVGPREKVSEEQIATSARLGMTKSQAAKKLGLSLDHLCRRAKRHGITFKEARGGRPWADRKDQP